MPASLKSSVVAILCGFGRLVEIGLLDYSECEKVPGWQTASSYTRRVRYKWVWLL